MRHVISLLIENESGALSRVSGLFSARGYNIESLTVAPTEEASVSRMTIITSGSDEIVEQMRAEIDYYSAWAAGEVYFVEVADDFLDDQARIGT